MLAHIAGAEPEITFAYECMTVYSNALHASTLEMKILRCMLVGHCLCIPTLHHKDSSWFLYNKGMAFWLGDFLIERLVICQYWEGSVCKWVDITQAQKSTYHSTLQHVSVPRASIWDICNSQASQSWVRSTFTRFLNHVQTPCRDEEYVVTRTTLHQVVSRK